MLAGEPDDVCRLEVEHEEVFSIFQPCARFVWDFFGFSIFGGATFWEGLSTNQKESVLSCLDEKVRSRDVQY